MQVFRPSFDWLAATRPGEPFRLLPVGKLVKDGNEHFLTVEELAKFKLPHFKPPIKLGSHNEDQRAGGFIIDLEVREDGLYAIPEYTDEGQASIERGDYRYHSPEILWGALENPSTGQLLEGPLIVGDAFLHNPHLGEAAALFSTEVKPMGQTLDEQVSIIERLSGIFSKVEPTVEKPATPVQPTEPVETYEAEYMEAKKELDQLKADMASMQATTARQQRVALFAAEFEETVLAADEEVHDVLADLTDEQAAVLVRKLKALAEQADAADLDQDVGGNSEDYAGNATDALSAAIAKVMSDQKVSYADAFMTVQREQPQLFNAWAGGK